MRLGLNVSWSGASLSGICLITPATIRLVQYWSITVFSSCSLTVTFVDCRVETSQFISI